ncbi:MAG: radical SAM family heme chaperone HemW [Clostridiales bacterium]|nr:radical SAM family heme chaperone HemW [Clostridiales bacterium]
MIKKKLSVYIHIPFCKEKCAYCDFLSFAQRDAFFGRYIDALLNEITANADLFRDQTVGTIFIGGGTPSVIPSIYIERIISRVFDLFSVSEDAEITIEANPESVSIEKLSDYKKAGVNRVSFGVQSFDDRILKKIGRLHSAERAEKALRDARAAGFSNISLDLMFGLPGQTRDDLKKTLEIATALNPEHLSCYGLILEEGTKLFQLYEQQVFEPASEAEEVEQYNFAKRFLAKNGYTQYEISNFAKPGFASKHNLGYWSDVPYIGFGLGAHSYIGRQRFHRTENFEDYLESDFSRKDIENLTLTDRYAEYMFLGLRKTVGVKASDFQAAFGVSVFDIYEEVIEKHSNDGMLLFENGFFRLTEKGILLSNRVFADFL